MLAATDHRDDSLKGFIQADYDRLIPTHVDPPVTVLVKCYQQTLVQQHFQIGILYNYNNHIMSLYVKY